MDLEERVRILEKKVEELESWRGISTHVDRGVDRETAKKEIKEWLERRAEKGKETFYISDITSDLHLDRNLVESIIEEAAISAGEKRGVLLVDKLPKENEEASNLEKHCIYATEPVFLECKHRYDPETGSPVEVKEVERTLIEDMADASEYRCSCGEEFGSWSDAVEHLESVNEQRERPTSND